jgi:hypothetical protein
MFLATFRQRSATHTPIHAPALWDARMRLLCTPCILAMQLPRELLCNLGVL